MRDKCVGHQQWFDHVRSDLDRAAKELKFYFDCMQDVLTLRDTITIVLSFLLLIH